MMTLTMTKVTPAFSFLWFISHITAITVDPYHRHVIVSPHSASEFFYTGSERGVLAPAPVVETPVAEPAAPIAAFAPAPASLALGAPAPAAPLALGAPAPAAPLAIGAPAPAAPLALGAPAPAAPLAIGAPAPAAPLALGAPAPVPVTPVVAKVAQFKLSYPQYAYGYSVQDFTTGDNKVAKEVREGGIVKGSYSVADPDGTKRTVNYYADPVHGFNAVVHKTQIL